MNPYQFGRMMLLLAAFFAVTACGTVDRNDPQDTQPYRANQFNNGVQSFDNRMDADRDNTANMHGNTRIEISQEIADRIAAMEEVDSANVLVTDRNIYVAVMLKDDQTNRNPNGTDHGDIPVTLKNKIARVAKSVNTAADQVYISANPDFVSRINGYVDQIQAGRPIQGLIEELNTLVQRMFPTNVDTDTEGTRMMNSGVGTKR